MSPPSFLARSLSALLAGACGAICGAQETSPGANLFTDSIVVPDARTGAPDYLVFGGKDGYVIRRRP